MYMYVYVYMFMIIIIKLWLSAARLQQLGVVAIDGLPQLLEDLAAGICL